MAGTGERMVAVAMAAMAVLMVVVALAITVAAGSGHPAAAYDPNHPVSRANRSLCDADVPCLEEDGDGVNW